MNRRQALLTLAALAALRPRPAYAATVDVAALLGCLAAWRVGLPPLVWDAELARAAEVHATTMRDTGIRHALMGGRGARGECIAAGQATWAEAFVGWTTSPNHLPLLIDPRYSHVGMGGAVGGAHGHYWVLRLWGRA